MRKIKWKNVGLTIILIICAGIVLHDLYVLLIEPILTTMVKGWTWYGLLTFIIALITSCSIIDYFNDELNIKKDLWEMRS